MDASHLLSLLRSPASAAGPAVPTPSAAPTSRPPTAPPVVAQSASGNDLDRLFKIFNTNPLTTASAPVVPARSESQGMTVEAIERVQQQQQPLVHSGQVSSRQSPIPQPRKSVTPPSPTLTSPSRVILPLRSPSAAVINNGSVGMGNPSSGSPSSASSSSRTLSFPLRKPSDASSLLAQLMGKKSPLPSPAAANPAPMFSTNLPPFFSESPVVFTAPTAIEEPHVSVKVVQAVVAEEETVGDGSPIAYKRIKSSVKSSKSSPSKSSSASVAVNASLGGGGGGEEVEDVKPVAVVKDYAGIEERLSSPFTFVSPFDALEAAHEEDVRIKLEEKDAQAGIEQEEKVQAVATVVEDVPIVQEETEKVIKQEEVEEEESTVIPQLAQTYLAQPTPASSSFEPTNFLTINLSSPNVDTLFRNPVQVNPIALLKNEASYEHGTRVWGGKKTIAYATKQGRVRIIDRTSGARMILKPSPLVFPPGTTPRTPLSTALLDLCVSPLVYYDTPSKGGKKTTSGTVGCRWMVTVGGEGRSILWKVPDEFDDPTALIQEEKLLVSPVDSKITASLARFSPGGQYLALARSDGLVDEASIEEVGRKNFNFGVKWAREKSVVTEPEMSKTIVDFAYSPDGTLLVILHADGTYSVRTTRAYTTGPARQYTGFLALAGLTSLDQVVWTASSTIAIACNKGNIIVFYSLLEQGLFDYTQVGLIQEIGRVELQARGVTEESFGHVSFSTALSTLFISTALRGSLIALHLSLSPASQKIKVEESDADRLVERLDAQVKDQCLVQLVIDSVKEITTPQRIVGYYLDETTTAGGGGKSKQGGLGVSKLEVLISYPQGNHEVSFELPILPAGVVPDAEVLPVILPALVEPLEQINKIDEGAARRQAEGHEEEPEISVEELAIENGGARRMSLKDSILVSEEVAIKIDEMVAQDAFHHSSSSLPPATIAPIAVSADVPAPTATAAEITVLPPVVVVAAVEQLASTPHVPPPTLTATAQTNAAIKSMKSSKSPKPTPSASSTPASTAKNANSSSTVTNMWANGGAAGGGGKSGKALVETVGMEMVLKELKKLEEGLQGRVERAVNAGLEKQAQQFAAIRLEEQSAETSRQENLLQLISTTLTTNTGRLVENSLKQSVQEEISSRVIPSLQEFLNSFLSEAIPRQLQQLISAPEISAQLSNSIVPLLTQVLQTQALASSQQLVQVLNKREDETRIQIAALHRQVEAMSEQMKSMQTTLIELATVTPAPVVAVVPVPVVAPVTRAASVAPAPVPISAPAPAPIRAQPVQRIIKQELVAPAPPPAQLEEIFTQILQPHHESDHFHLLDQMIHSSPTLLSSVFPPGGPRISFPVVLSLAFRLAQIVERGETELGKKGALEVAWIGQCVACLVPSMEPETLAYAPQVLDSILRSLTVRRNRLLQLQDMAGINEIGLVGQQVMSRLGSIRAVLAKEQ